MANIDFAQSTSRQSNRNRAGQGWRAVAPAGKASTLAFAFGALAVMVDLAAILGAGAAIGHIWHATRYMSSIPPALAQICVAIAFFVVVPGLLGRQYVLAQYLDRDLRAGDLFRLWNIAFFAAFALAFLTKSTDQLSRVVLLGLYVGGFGALLLSRLLLSSHLREQCRRRKVAARRLMLVGCERAIDEFMQRVDMSAHGLDIVAASILRAEEESLTDDLALAEASARMLRPDDILILFPWSRKERIEACLQAFLRVPAAIHLGPERVIARLEDAQIVRLGPVSSLSLARRPLGAAEIFAKRALDLVLASLALLLLSPVMALVALAIRIESGGPVLFAQRRYGFNQEPFRILKFRSMTTMEDGRHVRQCSENDARLTRVGAFIRRWNLDELPQLFNVLRGEMSLVGPRPHAMTHDQAFDAKIDLYARRHNVRPGITGWAQVNGFRGATDTDEKILRRVEHDLYYIDNWSLLFDLRILFLTVFSPKAYRNAR